MASLFFNFNFNFYFDAQTQFNKKNTVGEQKKKLIGRDKLVGRKSLN
jgi:hypothetical protein